MKKLHRLVVMVALALGIAAPAAAHVPRIEIAPSIDLREAIAVPEVAPSFAVFTGSDMFDDIAHVELPPPSIADELAQRFAAADVASPSRLAIFDRTVSRKLASGPLAAFEENNTSEINELSLELRKTAGNARERWYDPGTGSFLSPDPIGYGGGSSNLYAFCGGDPVNCSDPDGLRAMTAEDKQRLAMLKARGKKLYDDFTSTGRGSFMQPMRVPVARKWYDTSGVPGGNYETQMVSATVTTPEYYELAKRTMVNDIATFEAAVARADANGEILYVPGQGFTTITAEDQRSADRSTMIAAGIFFATDTLPMMFAPTRVEPVEEIGGVQVPQSEVARFKGARAKANRDRGNAWRDEIADEIRAHGSEARTEVEKDTPFGPRFMDVEVGPVENPLGGIEAKEGNSPYKPDQRAKDEYLRRNGYPVHVVRKPKGK